MPLECLLFMTTLYSVSMCAGVSTSTPSVLQTSSTSTLGGKPSTFTPSTRITALNMVGDLLRKVGVSPVWPSPCHTHRRAQLPILSHTIPFSKVRGLLEHVIKQVVHCSKLRRHFDPKRAFLVLLCTTEEGPIGVETSCRFGSVPLLYTLKNPLLPYLT